MQMTYSPSYSQDTLKPKPTNPQPLVFPFGGRTCGEGSERRGREGGVARVVRVGPVRVEGAGEGSEGRPCESSGHRVCESKWWEDKGMACECHRALACQSVAVHVIEVWLALSCSNQDE